MRIARAAKGAALLLMVFGLVALIGCQQAATGATGPQGPAGKPGAAGDPGPAGKPGAAGADALSAKSGDRVSHYVGVTKDENDNDDDEVEIGTLRSINAAAQFVGGKLPITYEITTDVLTGSTFTAEIDPKTGMVAVALQTATQKNPVDNTPPHDWVFDVAIDPPTSSIFTVMATDANGVTATTDFVILFNRKPIFENTDQANVWVHTVGTDGQATSTKTMTLSSGTDDSVTTIHFSDHDIEDMKYNLQGKLPPAVMVTPDPKEASEFEIKGVSSTHHENPDDCVDAASGVTVVPPADKPEGYCIDTDTSSVNTWTDGHVPVEFKVRATDKGGEYRDGTAKVTVDGAPKLTTALPTPTVVKGTPFLINNLLGFFKDPEGDAITFTSPVESSSEVHATATITGTGSSTVLTITGVNVGTATLTIEAKSTGSASGLASEQTVEVDLEVRVTQS